MFFFTFCIILYFVLYNLFSLPSLKKHIYLFYKKIIGQKITYAKNQLTDIFSKRNVDAFDILCSDSRGQT
jgi:hypothetical protein